MSDPAILPLRNVPVVHVDISGMISLDDLTTALEQAMLRQNRSPNELIALAFAWTEPPDYRDLATLARAIKTIAAPHGTRQEALVLAIDGDIALTLGRILHREFGFDTALISIDGLHLRELDFVDVGEPIEPPGVVPVVIKSLLFS
ncbi:MAG: ethanolamine ammonia-lyase reactivating factor EutA [Rhizobiaceae bacterium]|nr:ethanolamine ammonia-lyase reactivating factor EutA [Rhizobiaceae bacterium]